MIYTDLARRKVGDYTEVSYQQYSEWGSKETEECVVSFSNDALLDIIKTYNMEALPFFFDGQRFSFGGKDGLVAYGIQDTAYMYEFYSFTPPRSLDQVYLAVVNLFTKMANDKKSLAAFRKEVTVDGFAQYVDYTKIDFTMFIAELVFQKNRIINSFDEVKISHIVNYDPSQGRDGGWDFLSGNIDHCRTIYRATYTKQAGFRVLEDKTVCKRKGKYDPITRMDEDIPDDIDDRLANPNREQYMNSTGSWVSKKPETINRYKDALPQDTINQITAIVAYLGIALDIQTKERTKGIFSATITDKANGWTTSGKGTTEEYCLASGYGEMIEHLCSYFAYDPSRLSEDAKEHLGFTRYPDEKTIQIADIPAQYPEVFADMKAAYCQSGKEPDNDQSVVAVWEVFLGAKTTNIAPYYSVKEDSVVYLPEAIIGSLCGSNGGGAGNTPAEAIGHGLDEICERYAKQQIYTKRLTPPTISTSYIEENYRFLHEIIKEIQEKYGYKVIVKDASLGKNLPVVAVLIVDQINHRYLVNFGSHPSFAVALERCFTELFQVFDPANTGMKRKDLARWKSHTDKEFDSIRNWVSLLRDDTGIIPHTFFAGQDSWDFKPWTIDEDYNNVRGVRNQLKNLQGLTESNIYIRDFSFLGFPVYRVYIPGISTTCLSLDEQQLAAFVHGNKMISRIQSNDAFVLTKDEMQELLENVFHPDSFISSLIFRNLSDSMLNALTAALYMDLGEEKVADGLLRQQDDRFCDCVVCELELKFQGVPEKSRNALLELFYGSKELEFALCWREKNVFVALITNFLGRKTLNLNGNSSRDLNQTDKLHKAVKDTMVKNIPNQFAIKETISSI